MDRVFSGVFLESYCEENLSYQQNDQNYIYPLVEEFSRFISRREEVRIQNMELSENESD